jgi:TPR repeat protein
MVVHAKAMYNLGVMYEHGLGVEQSYERAFEYYEQAADLGLGLGTIQFGCHVLQR